MWDTWHLYHRASGLAHTAAATLLWQHWVRLVVVHRTCCLFGEHLSHLWGTETQQALRHQLHEGLGALCSNIQSQRHNVLLKYLLKTSGGIAPLQIGRRSDGKLISALPPPPLPKKSPTHLQTSMHMPPGYSQPPEIPAWLAWLALDHLACDSSRAHLAETFLETSKLWIHPSILVKPVIWKAFQKQNFKYRLNFFSILRGGKKKKSHSSFIFPQRVIL